MVVLDTTQGKREYLCSYSKSHRGYEGFRFVSLLAEAHIFARLINISD